MVPNLWGKYESWAGLSDVLKNTIHIIQKNRGDAVVSIIRWKLSVENRIGIMEDVTRDLAFNHIPFSALEVYCGVIYLKFVFSDGQYLQEALGRLKNDFLQKDYVHHIDEIDLMPQEQREFELQAILGSVSEGVVALDNNGIVRYLNDQAAQLMRTSAEEAVGLHANSVIPGKLPIFKTLQTGESYDLVEISVDSTKDRFRYLSSGRPIKNEQGMISGAVATIKSIEDTRKLITSLTKSKTVAFEEIIHTSSSLEQAIYLAKKIADSKCTVLIRGESGTGKELFARAIYNASNRNNKAFVTINCAAIPETLLESELFGYEEGAFSGAQRGGKMGLFETAHEGTLFLDEVGELSIVLQSKLLRALQEGQIMRLGGRKPISVDVRIIAATNRNLEEMVREKTFREDLYYRLNVIPIRVPPLRESPEDIPFLIHHFLDVYGGDLKRDFVLDSGAMDCLCNRPWPGNVRELQNTLLRSVHLANGNIIKKKDLMLDDNKIVPIVDHGLKNAVGDLERVTIEASLKKTGSARGTAKELGLSHTVVLRRIHKYGLEHLIGK